MMDSNAGAEREPSASGEMVPAWFSDDLKGHARRELHFANLPTTDDSMAKVLRLARDIALVRSHEWRDASGVTERQLDNANNRKQLCDLCPTNLKLDYLSEAVVRRQGGVLNASLRDVGPQLVQEVMDRLPEAHLDADACREIVRRRVTDALRALDLENPTDSFGIDEIRARVVEPALEKSLAYLESHGLRNRITDYVVGLSSRVGLPAEVLDAVAAESIRMTKLAAFDDAFANDFHHSFSELVAWELRRQTDPVTRVFGEPFLDPDVAAELAEVLQWLSSAGRRELAIAIEESGRPFMFDPTDELFDRLETKLIRNWRGRDQLKLGPQHGHFVRYVKRAMRNVVVDRLMKAEPTMTALADDPAPPGVEPTELLTDALRDLFVTSATVVDEIASIIRRAGIEIAGVMADQMLDPRLTHKTRRSHADLFAIAAAVVEIERVCVEDFRASAPGQPDFERRLEELAGLVEVVVTVSRGHAKGRDRVPFTLLVFKAFTLCRPEWRVRYGGDLPRSGSDAPGLGRKEGSDYQEVYRRAHGTTNKDVTDPLVRGGVRGLLEGVHYDIAQVVRRGLASTDGEQ